METEIKIHFKFIFYIWIYLNAAIFISNKALDNLYSPLTESHGRQVFLGLLRLTGGDTYVPCDHTTTLRNDFQNSSWTT
jgi:hypothetical protein